MKDKSRRLTENSNWDSRRLLKMGWPENTIKVQVVQRLAIHYGWEKGPDAKSERQECPEAKGITMLCSPSYILFQGLGFGLDLVGHPSSL